jgi:hypothetical protein
MTLVLTHRRLFALAFLGAALAVLGGALAAASTREEKKDDGKSWFPGDGAIFLSVRLTDVLNSPLGKEVLKARPRDLLDAIKEQEKISGYKLTDVDSHSLMLIDLPTDPFKPAYNFVALVEFNKDVDAKKLRENMEKIYTGLMLKGEEAKAGDRKYFAYKSAPGGLFPFEIGLYQEGDRLYATFIGDKFVKILEKGRSKPEGPLAEAIARAKTNHLVAAASPALMTDIARKFIPKDYEALADYRTAILVGNVDKAGVTLEATGTFADEDKARAAVKSLEAARLAAVPLLAIPRKEAGEDKAKLKALDKVEAALKKATITRSRAEVVIQVKLEVEASDVIELRTLIKRLAALAFRD